MKKLTYTLLIAFLAGLVASTWTASASEIPGRHLIRAGNKTAHHAKAEKAGKKDKKQHKKKHGKKAKT